MIRLPEISSGHAALAGLAVGWLALAVGCGGSENNDLFEPSRGSGGSTAGGGSPGGSGGKASGGSGASGGVAGAGGVGGSAVGGSGAGGSGVGGSTGSGGAAGSGGASGSGGSSGSGVGGGSGAGGGGAGGASGSGGSATGGTGGSNNAGSVQCNTEPCSLEGNYCCRYIEGTPECIPTGATCTQGTDVLCDGPEDCTGEQVCCGVQVMFNGNPAYTRMSCQQPSNCSGNNDRIVCGAHPSACPQGRVCEQSSILPEYRFCGTP